MTVSSAFAVGFAELKIVDSNDTPISGVSIKLVKDDNVVFSDATGKVGVVQWTSDKAPPGRYIVRMSKGSAYMAGAMNLEYREGEWVFFKIQFNL